jgi:hypothetical protein
MIKVQASTKFKNAARQAVGSFKFKFQGDMAPVG